MGGGGVKHWRHYLSTLAEQIMVSYQNEAHLVHEFFFSGIVPKQDATLSDTPIPKHGSQVPFPSSPPPPQALVWK